MSLPEEVRTKYVNIIDDILSNSDLTQITEKRIRQGIANRVEHDITPQKAQIKALIMERFDIFNARQNGTNHADEPIASVEVTEPKPVTNGHKKSHSPPTKREADDSDLSDVIDNAPPKKKKRKATSEEDDDAAFAARLQAEEDRNARPTRGGGSSRKSASAKKKSSKKKTANKVTASDDSDVEDGTPKRKVNRNTGFHKPMNLSSTAADFFGSAQLSRPEVTKQVWQYIKGHDLQDPGDKRYIACDDKLQVLLGTPKIHMFQMTKVLNQHMYNPED